MAITRTLKLGSKGVMVAEWQQLLNQSGLVSQIVVDGDFGGGTNTATRTAQRKLNIKVDGIVGQQTLGAMEIYLGFRTGPVPPIGKLSDDPISPNEPLPEEIPESTLSSDSQKTGFIIAGILTLFIILKKAKKRRRR